jgi:4-amino-4-deoxy-L-arabinose transferase-like glycosyltransferase
MERPVAEVQIVDDSKLLQMAAPKAAELFPIFQRSESLSPLLFLLAVLPGLFALQYRTLDESTAIWGLKCLESVSPTSAELFAGATRSADVEMLRWQPPLASWLTGQIMALVGPSHWMGLLVVSFASTVGLIFSMFFLCRRLVGSRFAFWTILLLALHPMLLRQIQNPAPQSLALFAAVVSFWAFIAHRQDEESLVSFKLLASGIALGICLLAGGPISLIVVAILLVHVLALRGDSLSPGRRPRAERKQVWTGWPALQSLLVVVATAFAVGGWWVMMMSWQYGLQFWEGWLGGAAQLPAGSELTVRARKVLGRFIHMNGGVFGLTLLGLYCAARGLIHPTDETRRRRLQFLVAWAGTAAIVWLKLARDGSVASYVLALWDGFLMLPCIALAALAIDEISRRAVSLPVAVGASCVSFAAALVSPSLRAETIDIAESWVKSPLSKSLGLVALLVAILVIATRMLATLGTRVETRRQLLLTMLLVAQLGVNAGIGLATARRRTPEDKALASCRNELSAVQGVRDCTIVTDSEPPPTVWFLVRSLWPDADLTTAGNWDEALSALLSNSSEVTHSSLVLDWTGSDIRPANIHIEGVHVEPIGRPQVLYGRQLRVFRVSISDESHDVASAIARRRVP